MSLAILILLAQNLAFGKSQPWSWLPGPTGRILWLAVSAGFAVFMVRGVPARIDAVIDRCLRARAWVPLLCLGNLALALYSAKHFASFGYAMPWHTIFACGLALPFLKRGNLVGSCLLSLAILYGSIRAFPLDPLRSDMLPSIHQALKQWLDAGISPYAVFDLANGRTGMPYLPGTLFSHLPAFLLGLDLRWNQLFYRAIWFGLVILHSKRLPQDSRERDALQFFILNPYWNFRHDLYFEAFFLLIVAFRTLPGLKPVSSALLVFTRQWAWVLYPFFWLEKGFARGKAALALLLAVFATALALRASTTLDVFLATAFSFQKKLDSAAYVGDYGLTLAPLFYSANLTRFLQPLQGALCLYLFWKAARNREQTLSFAAVALCFFVLLNMHFWLYFWLTPALWLSLSLPSVDSASPRAEVTR